VRTIGAAVFWDAAGDRSIRRAEVAAAARRMCSIRSKPLPLMLFDSTFCMTGVSTMTINS
jgi:hypothetical protein